MPTQTLHDGNIAADILAQQMQNGTAPWQQATVPGDTLNHNPVSNTPYRGMNQMILNVAASEREHTDSRWMTYKQAQAVGAQVREGETGVRLQSYSLRPVDRKATKVEREILSRNTDFQQNGRTQIWNKEFSRQDDGSIRCIGQDMVAVPYRVFNAEQIDGLPAEETLTFNEETRNVRIEQLVESMGITVENESGETSGYIPSTDTIEMPTVEEYESFDEYYKDLLHEVSHATGHQSRLDRDMTGKPGTDDFAREELRAEISTYLLSSELGVPYEPRERTAEYVQEWVSQLDDPANEIATLINESGSIHNHVMDRDIEVDMSFDPRIDQSLSVTRDDRIYLDTQYEERKEVKDLGAKWDVENKQWFVPEGQNLEPFAKWIQNQEVIQDFENREQFVRVGQQLPHEYEGVDLDIDDNPVLSDYQQRLEDNIDAAQQLEEEPTGPEIDHLPSDDITYRDHYYKHVVDLNDAQNDREYVMLDDLDAELLPYNNDLSALTFDSDNHAYYFVPTEGHSEAFYEAIENYRLNSEELLAERNIYNETELIDMTQNDKYQLPSESEISEIDLNDANARLINIIENIEPDIFDAGVSDELRDKLQSYDLGPVLDDNVLHGEKLGSAFLANELANANLNDPDQLGECTMYSYAILKYHQNEAQSNDAYSPELVAHMDKLISDIRNEYDIPSELDQSASKESTAQKVANDRNNREYLNVPYSERNWAKKHGAQWDKTVKSWYVEGEKRNDPNLDRWKTNTLQKETPEAQFNREMAKAGLIIDAPLVLDGKWHSVPVQGGDPEKKPGSYRGFNDGVPNVQFTNHKDHPGRTFKSVYRGSELDPKNKEEMSKSVAERQVDRQAEKAKYAEQNQAKFMKILNEAKQDYALSSYMEDKGITRPIPGTVERFGNLHVPLREINTNPKEQIAGKVVGIQYIAGKDSQYTDKKGNEVNVSQGDKSYLAGSIKDGSAFFIGNPDTNNAVMVAEGIATAETLHQSTKLPVVVAFDAGNLEKVTQQLRERYPDKEIIIAADNDKLNRHNKNVGIEKANEAAANHKAHVISPPFTEEERNSGLTDFNDYQKHVGAEKNKLYLTGAIDRVMEEPEAQKRQERLRETQKSNAASSDMEM